MKTLFDFQRKHALSEQHSKSLTPLSETIRWKMWCHQVFSKDFNCFSFSLINWKYKIVDDSAHCQIKYFFHSFFYVLFLFDPTLILKQMLMVTIWLFKHVSTSASLNEDVDLCHQTPSLSSSALPFLNSYFRHSQGNGKHTRAWQGWPLQRAWVWRNRSECIAVWW